MQIEDLGNGCYRVSLHELQQARSNVTTKDVLLPLLKDPKYREFEVLCRFIPSWLLLEIMDCRLPGEIKKLPDGTMRVRITRKLGCG